MSQAGSLATGGGPSGDGILTITGNTGGAVPGDVSRNINVLGGTGIAISGDAGTNTLTVAASGSASFNWIATTDSSITMLPNTGYILTGDQAADITITTPLTVGDLYGICATGLSSWSIAVAPGFSISVVDVTTSSSFSGGGLTSGPLGTCIVFVANTTSSFQTISLMGRVGIK